jgi:twitching motility protein PilJ
MDRLRYAPKFLLIGGLFLIPVLTLAYLQYSVNTEQADFNQKEATGVDYLVKAFPLQRALADYRVASMSATDATANASRVTEARDAVDKALQDLGVIDAKVGGEAALKTSNQYKEINDKWTNLKKTRFSSIYEADSELDKLSAMNAKLILDYACNYSNLILDPELDSYYLMDTVCLKIPFLMESIADQSAAALRASRAGSINSSDRIDLAGLHKSSLATAGDMTALNMTTVFAQENGKKLQGDLKGPFESAEGAVKKFGDFIRGGLLEEGATPPGPATIQQATSQALDQVSNLADRIAGPLRTLCTDRAHFKYEIPRRNGVLIVAAALLLIFYVLTALYFSTRSSIAQARDAAEGMIKGTVKNVTMSSRDELGEIATSFNQISKALVEARELRQRIEVENNQLQESIFEMLQVVSKAADGDLTARAKVTEGAMGNVADAFNSMMDSLQGLTRNITTQLEQTRVAIESVTSATEATARGSNEQVSGFIETQTLLTKFTRELQEVSKVARNAADAARRTETSAKDGSGAVADVIRGMDGLRAKVQGGAKKVKTLGDRSMEITAIVATIARISEQTNLLALNAAIEAVRAGEHGQGFSIVADEVRKLAERTAAATQEIEKLVKTIQLETNESVDAIEQQTVVVEKEVEIVGRAGEALARIQGVSTETAQIVDSINRVSEEQVKAIAQVTDRMGAVSNIAQASLQSARVTVDQLTALRARSEELTANVRKFKVQ